MLWQYADDDTDDNDHGDHPQVSSIRLLHLQYLDANSTGTSPLPSKSFRIFKHSSNDSASRKVTSNFKNLEDWMHLGQRSLIFPDASKTEHSVLISKRYVCVHVHNCTYLLCIHINTKTHSNFTTDIFYVPLAYVYIYK